jgi:hypothetical protein
MTKKEIKNLAEEFTVRATTLAAKGITLSVIAVGTRFSVLSGEKALVAEESSRRVDRFLSGAEFAAAALNMPAPAGVTLARRPRMPPAINSR